MLHATVCNLVSPRSIVGHIVTVFVASCSDEEEEAWVMEQWCHQTVERCDMSVTGDKYVARDRYKNKRWSPSHMTCPYCLEKKNTNSFNQVELLQH